MITINELDRIYHADVYGPDGTKIGSAGQVYLDNNSGQPEWVAVRTGLLGTKESFVPLAQATLSGNRLDVPFGKEQVSDAPNIDTDGELTPIEEDELYRYYGLISVDGSDVDRGDTPDRGYDAPGDSTGNDLAAVTTARTANNDTR